MSWRSRLSHPHWKRGVAHGTPRWAPQCCEDTALCVQPCSRPGLPRLSLGASPSGVFTPPSGRAEGGFACLEVPTASVWGQGQGPHCCSRPTPGWPELQVQGLERAPGLWEAELLPTWPSLGLELGSRAEAGPLGRAPGAQLQTGRTVLPNGAPPGAQVHPVSAGADPQVWDVTGSGENTEALTWCLHVCRGQRLGLGGGFKGFFIHPRV